MPVLTVKKQNQYKEIRFRQGESLLSVLRRGGIPVNAPCGGNGTCGKCLVTVERDGIPVRVRACAFPASEEFPVLLETEAGTEISWNTSAYVPEEKGGTEGLGAAIDLGTTSIAVSLFDFGSGARLETAGQWNAQQSWGADVISRIAYTMDHPDGLKVLSDCVRNQILQMITSLCVRQGRNIQEVRKAFLAGNTTMQHIFAGLPPAGIAAAPFEPLSYFEDGDPSDLGGIPVVLSPCVSGYVGGDITAGLLAMHLEESPTRDLFLDVGTNGEMAVGGRDGFTACSVACGPAFEGAGISCGMPAENGAVNRVYFSGDELVFETIGGGEPKGICGSGLLDLAACLLEAGYITPSGMLLCEEESGEAVFRITERVFLSARDVRQLQLAKAAVAAGIEILLRRSGYRIGDIGTLWLAGGFGNRLNPESASRIGMFPAELLDRVRTAGNASLAGAEEALMDSAASARLQTIRKMCSYIELSSDEEFKDCFIEQMAFPEAPEDFSDL